MPNTPGQQPLAGLPPYAGSAVQRAYDRWLGHCAGCPMCTTGPRVATCCTERAELWQAYLDARGDL